MTCGVQTCQLAEDKDTCEDLECLWYVISHEIGWYRPLSVSTG